MRDYLYCFFDKQDGCLRASGIEFKDICPTLCRERSLMLLEHDYADASYYAPAHLHYVAPADQSAFLQEDINAYGNFSCFTCSEPEHLMQPGVLAEILYFAHMGRFESGTPPLPQELFYAAHDDGWQASIYAEPNALQELLVKLCTEHFPQFNRALLEATLNGGKAIWIDRHGSKALAADKAIDHVLQNNLRR